MVTSRAKRPTTQSSVAPKSAPVQRTESTLPVVAPEAPKRRVKLVRDSFTMPRDDFVLIDVLKQRALSRRRVAKKSELIRAGLRALHALDDAALCLALSALTPLPVERPKKPR